MFDKNLVKGSSVLKEHREVSLRLQKLPKGRYIIVPSTRNVGEYGEYTLSIYINKGLDDVVFGNDECKFYLSKIVILFSYSNR